MLDVLKKTLTTKTSPTPTSSPTTPPTDAPDPNSTTTPSPGPDKTDSSQPNVDRKSHWPGGKPNLQVPILGPPGAGKTTRAKARLTEAVQQGWWAWIHDPNNDYAEHGTVWRSPAEFVDACRRGPVSPIARFRGDPLGLVGIDPTTGDPVPGGAAHFSWYGTRPTLLVFDESSLVGSPYRLDAQLGQLVFRRRHLGLGLLFVFQRPTSVHESVLSQATEIDIFRIVSKKHRDTLVDRGISDQYMDRVAKLQDFEFVTAKIGRDPDYIEPKPQV